MAFSFKLPLWSNKTPPADYDPLQETQLIRANPSPTRSQTKPLRNQGKPAANADLGAWSGRKGLPLLGSLPTVQQLLILGAVLFLIFEVGAVKL